MVELPHGAVKPLVVIARIRSPRLFSPSALHGFFCFARDWLADKLAVPELDAQPPLSPDFILHVGARLLGFYVIIQAAPVLVGQLGGTISAIRQVVGLSDAMGAGFMERMVFDRIWSGLVAPGLKLAFGFLLVLKTDLVLKWIDGKSQTAEPENGPVRE